MRRKAWQNLASVLFENTYAKRVLLLRQSYTADGGHDRQTLQEEIFINDYS
jgi:hypothetical protein